jgi:stage 0 sporulation protein B (sporulation initiation phosphotransferase)
MKPEEVLHMFRHYRHDQLNDLQLVLGYTQMGNLDKVKDKLHDILEKTAEERKLANLNCPHFTVWTMNFNTKYNNLKLSYEVHLSKGDFSAVDLKLKETCEEITQLLHKHLRKERLYNIELIIYDEEQPTMLLTINDELLDLSALQENLLTKTLVEQIEVKDSTCQIKLKL